MIQRKYKRTARIGIFAVAHAVYWEQFEGLYEKIMGYHREFVKMVEERDAEVVDFGMIDSNEKAYEILPKMQSAGIDLLFCNMVTYATSSVFAPILKEMNTPIVLVALQPRKAMDYTCANTFMQLENDNICAVPEFTCVAKRFGRPVKDVIIGTLHADEIAEKEVTDWCDVAKVLHDLHGARIGLMGHVLEAMYDMHADPTAISSAFGVHVPLLEIDDVVSLYDEISKDEIQKKIQTIEAEFLMPEPKSDPVTRKLTKEDLYESARTAVLLDHFIEKYKLTGLAYYYEGKEGSIQRKVASSFIVGNSMLIGEGFPMCGEFDIKTCIAMLIMDRLDMGGSFAEFHPFDFNEDFIMVGHDGPHHLRVAEGKPVLRSLIKYHGKPGSGASVEFKLKEGPITMLGITQDEHGKFRFIIGEGTSKHGPIPPTGNTNTRGFFEPTTREFMKRWVMEGPTHHYALGIGHRADVIRKVADVLGIDSVIVKG